MQGLSAFHLIASQFEDEKAAADNGDSDVDGDDNDHYHVEPF